MKTEKGKYVYRDEPSEKRMHAFYDKALDSLRVEYSETYAKRVFPKTEKIFSQKPEMYRITGKHLLSDETMRFVCDKITEFFVK